MYLLSSHSGKTALSSKLELSRALEKSVRPQIFDLAIKIFLLEKRGIVDQIYIFHIHKDRDVGVFVYHN